MRRAGGVPGSAMVDQEPDVRQVGMTPGEARKIVSDLASAQDVQSAVRVFVETDSSYLLDRLKVAEYALLVDPIQQAVRALLQNIESGDVRINPDAAPEEVAGQLSKELIDLVTDRLQQSGRYELVDELAERRATLLRKSELGQMVAPISHAIRSASMSAVHSMQTAAEASYHVARRSSSGPELRDAVRSSTHLAFAHPVVHLEDHAIVNIILRAHNGLAVQGRVHPEALLRLEQGKVVLAKPIAKWNLGPTLQLEDVADRHGDVKVGCPFSFAGRDIREKFYQAVLDSTLGSFWEGEPELGKR